MKRGGNFGLSLNSYLSLSRLTLYGGDDQCFVSGSGIQCFFDPWIRDPGWVKKQDPDPGWTSRIIFPRAWETIFWVKILNSLMQIPDTGWKKFGSGIRNGKIRIRDKHHGSATLGMTLSAMGTHPVWWRWHYQLGRAALGWAGRRGRADPRT